ncbi:uncharacterized protein LOC114383659 [Glycine soja]|uniref:uncharacterized protein LOC114383659 n=1 Tax=Glycine soja TaxID=3848 RepID=UPI0008628E27|nr:uncharacterized protein LOC114383659 [Glycine soja]
MAKFKRSDPEIEGLVAASGLSPLIACSLDTGNRGLMSAFVECWHKETNSFHLLVREVTFTLDDVASLLHLLVVGAFHSFELLHVDDAVDMLVELLEVSAVEVRAETIQCDGSYVRLLWLRDVYQTKIKACDWIVAVRAYLLHLLRCTLFANKSATHVHVCWIYEHFSFVGSVVPVEDYDERRPRACRWTSGKALLVSTYHKRLDRLTPDVTISPHPAASSLSVEEIDDRWMQLSEYIAPIGQLRVVPGHCSPDYMDWFYMISHSFMSSAQLGDPPRVSPVQQYDTFVKPDVYQQLMAAAAPNEANVDVHHVQHAVDGFVAIADKLERLLNLRILTEGTQAYTVAEECLGIIRSYIS